MKKIGTDIVNLRRIARVLHSFRDKFTKKILSGAEFKYFNSLSSERRRIEFLGGRFCGKEAIFKAHGAPLTWKNVSIESQNGGPAVFLNGKPWESMLISISHEEEYAVAFALFTK